MGRRICQERRWYAQQMFRPVNLTSECSQSTALLEEHFGIARPWDFVSTDLVQVVLQTNSAECTAEEETTGGTVTVNTGSAASVLCFGKDSWVSMADGTQKVIAEIQVGDIVDTGTGHGNGLVTEVLKHPVNAVVPLVRVPTEFGDLLGTPDHPVWNEKTHEWEDFSAATSVVGVEELFVDVLYNLEVDGDTPGGSSHSYVVNGVVASGLGDSEVLNLMFARQKVWSEANRQ